MAVDGLDADLFDAVEFGDRDLADVLLNSADVNVDAQDLSGNTILMLASYYGHLELVQLILSRGAAPNLQDKQGRTALQRARDLGHLEVVELLKKAGAV